MTYNIYERSSWRNDTVKYDVRWNIYTNRPIIQMHTQGCRSGTGVLPVRKPRNTYKAELRRIRTCSRKYRRLYRKTWKNPLWYTVIYCRAMLRRNAESSGGKSGKTGREKPSIRKQLNELKADQKKNSQEPQKTRPEMKSDKAVSICGTIKFKLKNRDESYVKDKRRHSARTAYRG